MPNDSLVTESAPSPYGPPLKSGFTYLDPQMQGAMEEFFQSCSLRELLAHPLLDSRDQEDSLLRSPTGGGFLMAFDFHLQSWPNPPQLIEINTNAGGLASIIELCRRQEDTIQALFLEEAFVDGLISEWQRAKGPEPLQVAIVDDDVTTQFLYPEMHFFSDLLRRRGIPCWVLSPEELTSHDDGSLWRKSERITFLYNRLTDFRLTQLSHAHLRRALLTQHVAMAPHPSMYVRLADKTRLLSLKHPVCPPTYLLHDRPLQQWAQERKHWVFKPPHGAGSKGVYRGDKISLQKLNELPSDTVVQQHIPPSLAEDGSKFDIRMFTLGLKQILAFASRHFAGQVMEMRSPLSGYRLCHRSAHST